MNAPTITPWDKGILAGDIVPTADGGLTQVGNTHHYWRSESSAGDILVASTDDGEDTYRFHVSLRGDGPTVYEGEAATLDAAQAECEAYVEADANRKTPRMYIPLPPEGKYLGWNIDADGRFGSCGVSNYLWFFMRRHPREPHYILEAIFGRGSRSRQVSVIIDTALDMTDLWRAAPKAMHAFLGRIRNGGVVVQRGRGRRQRDLVRLVQRPPRGRR